jgi:hypothetical protein
MTSQQIPTSADFQWRKSSYSNAGNQCVEVARISGAVAVRDSKSPGGGHLTFAAVAWETFIEDIKHAGYGL